MPTRTLNTEMTSNDVGQSAAVESKAASGHTPSTVRLRQRGAAALTAVALAAATAACTGAASPPNAAQPPSPAGVSSAPSWSASPSASSVTSTISTCTIDDNLVFNGFTTWQDQMSHRQGFADGLKFTTDFASFTGAVAKNDTQAHTSPNATLAQTLATAASKVQADMQYGVRSGKAADSYDQDMQAVIAAGYPFEPCQ